MSRLPTPSSWAIPCSGHGGARGRRDAPHLGGRAKRRSTPSRAARATAWCGRSKRWRPCCDGGCQDRERARAISADGRHHRGGRGQPPPPGRLHRARSRSSRWRASPSSRPRSGTSRRRASRPSSSSSTSESWTAWSGCATRFPRLPIRFIVKTTASSLESFLEVTGTPGGGRMLVSTVDAWCRPADFTRFVEAAIDRPREATVLAVTPSWRTRSPCGSTSTTTAACGARRQRRRLRHRGDVPRARARAAPDAAERARTAEGAPDAGSIVRAIRCTAGDPEGRRRRSGGGRGARRGPRTGRLMIGSGRRQGTDELSLLGNLPRAGAFARARK